MVSVTQRLPRAGFRGQHICEYRAIHREVPADPSEDANGAVAFFEHRAGRVELPDVAQAFNHRACAPLHTEFETLHFQGYAITGQELLNGIEAAATELGLRPPQGFRIGGLPWGLIRAVGRVYRPWRELASMSYLWNRPHALDGRALASRVALPPATPMVQALRHSLIDLGLAPAKAAAPARATTSA